MPDHDDRVTRPDLDQLRPHADGDLPPTDPVRDPPAVSRFAWIGLVALLVVVAAGLWVWLRDDPAAPVPVAEAPTTAAEPVERRAVSQTGLGIGEPDPDLPPLSQLDAYVRPLLAALSRRPELAALLATDDLVRRFVVSVDAIGRGATPARQVRAVAPREPFAVRSDGGALVIAPSSYARYDGLVRLVEDMDPQRLARLYGQLKPRLEEAHRELGVDGTFDDAMIRALTHLLDTPTIPAAPRVQVGKGTNYRYADADLEQLSAAQRQLLRLGPERAARVKARLREFAGALGVPSERLSANS
jgi:hypothetical protein